MLKKKCFRFYFNCCTPCHVVAFLSLVFFCSRWWSVFTINKYPPWIAVEKWFITFDTFGCGSKFVGIYHLVADEPKKRRLRRRRSTGNGSDTRRMHSSSLDWTTILIAANGNCRWWYSESCPPWPSFPSPFSLLIERGTDRKTSLLLLSEMWSEGKEDRHQPLHRFIKSIFKNLSNLVSSSSSSAYQLEEHGDNVARFGGNWMFQSGVEHLLLQWAERDSTIYFIILWLWTGGSEGEEDYYKGVIYAF